MIVIEREASGHTDVTDVFGQRRMEQDRVESRRMLHKKEQRSLSRHQDVSGSD